MTKRLLAGALAVMMTLTAAPAPQAPPAKPVKTKKSRKGMWIAVGVTAAAAVTVGAVVGKRIGNER